MEDDNRFLDEIKSIASELGVENGFFFSEEENAYVFDGKQDYFDCPSCNEEVTFGECACGTTWYVFHILDGSSVKTLARKVDPEGLIKKMAFVNKNETSFELL